LVVAGLVARDLAQQSTIKRQSERIEEQAQGLAQQQVRLSRMDTALSALARTSERREAAGEASRSRVEDIRNEDPVYIIGDSPALSSVFDLMREREGAGSQPARSHTGGDADLPEQATSPDR
jgi:hypothetical protein